MTTTNCPHKHDLSSPFWTIHLAQALSISTRTARAYSRGHDFPAPLVPVGAAPTPG